MSEKPKKKIRQVIIKFDNGEESGFGFYYNDPSDFKQRIVHRDVIVKFLYKYSGSELKDE